MAEFAMVTSSAAQTVAAAARPMRQAPTHGSQGVFDVRPQLVNQRRLQQHADSSQQAVQLSSRLSMMTAPIQRTIFNMGDDPALADRDGAYLAGKLKQDYVKIPIPQLAAEDGILAHASNPFVVMFHGSTLKKMGARSFQETLISRGYPRTKGLELVLITCSAKSILGEHDAQDLANTLQSKVRVAKGKVSVRPDGIPVVTIKGDARLHSEDIFSLMGDLFEDFAEGWSLYTPQPEKTLEKVERDARRQIYRAQGLVGDMQRLLSVKTKAEDPSDIDALDVRVRALLSRAQGDLDLGMSMRGKASNEGMLAYREKIDQAGPHADWIEDEVREQEQSWAARNGKSIARYLLDLEFQADHEHAPEPTEVGNGWDVDFDLDALLEEEPTPALAQHGGASDAAASTSTGQQASSSSGETVALKAYRASSLLTSPVMQRAVTTPVALMPDGRSIAALMAGLADINLVAGAEINLTVLYGDEGEDKYAVTRLLMDGEIVIPFEALTVANAEREFSIEIVLSETEFQGGQAAPEQLIPTLTHEWELHGRQFAQNIHKLKGGEMPDAYLGHGHFFEPGAQDYDQAMAAGIEAAPAEHKAAILNNYLGDATAHEGFVMEGWDEENNAKALSLHKAIRDLKASWSILKVIPPDEAQAVYEAHLLALMPHFADGYFNGEEADVTAEGLHFFIDDPRAVYSYLIAAFASAIPPEPELYAAARESMKGQLRTILLDWMGFMDAVNKLENAEGKPRKAAMLGLGHGVPD